ncbi:MAG: STAS domain-containing protein [Oscillospiraceae bacterium]|jgi:stage II sporulation protein AA (anti-sigma F factor antagonist)|nr:STAS domain-containing protein [Oscillospiraceae bacterium]
MRIETAYQNGELRVMLHGELDHHAAGDTVREIERAVDAYMPMLCVVDLGGVTFMDSSGLAVLMKTRRRVTQIGGKVRVTGASERIERILNSAGIGKFIEITRREEVHIERN